MEETININTKGQVTIDYDFIKNYKYNKRGNYFEMTGNINCDNLYIKEPIYLNGNIQVNDCIFLGDNIIADKKITINQISAITSNSKPAYASLFVTEEIIANRLTLFNYVKIENRRK